MQKARDKKVIPTVVYDSPQYSIALIPLNYEIEIKLPKKPGFRTVGRFYYNNDELGLDFTHDNAKRIIEKYFIK